MSATGTSVVFLRPRPLETKSGSFLLLPLLPQRPPLKPLPVEVWEKIIGYLLCDDVSVDLAQKKGSKGSRHDILLVCKSMSNIALPLFYHHVTIRSPSSLEKFTERLYSADQKWDSLRRIPYSTPGRWVQTLDLSELDCSTRQNHIDSLLTRLFPLIPFLRECTLNPSMMLSGRAIDSLSVREGISNLTILKGIKGDASLASARAADKDLLVRALRFCENLRELEVIGPALDLTDPDMFQDLEPPSSAGFVPLNLPHLRKLVMLSTHSSALLYALLHSPLPSLSSLTITPYHDIPYPAALVSRFIDTHGATLRSLSLFTPKCWPTILHLSPPTLLLTSPNLKHLSLENPIPPLALGLDSSSGPGSRATHPLQVLSLPRPSAHLLGTLERMLPSLPSLQAVRARDVHWLRKGISFRAQEAGIQGVMREWARRLARRGIKVLDADWRECIE